MHIEDRLAALEEARKTHLGRIGANDSEVASLTRRITSLEAQVRKLFARTEEPTPKPHQVTYTEPVAALEGFARIRSILIICMHCNTEGLIQTAAVPKFTICSKCHRLLRISR